MIILQTASLQNILPHILYLPVVFSQAYIPWLYENNELKN